MNRSHFGYSWKKYESSSHYIFIYLSAFSVNLDFAQNVEKAEMENSVFISSLGLW